MRGSAIREGTSGIGFVDVLVTFSSGLVHVVELKMLKGKHVPGPLQLATYMNESGEGRAGWFFSIRNRLRDLPFQPNSRVPSGVIRTIIIDINPVPPSKRAEG